MAIGGMSGYGKFLLGYRSAQMHRLSCLHDGMQIRERSPIVRRPDLGQVRREGRLPELAETLRRSALQSLRKPALRPHLPDLGDVSAT